MKKNEPRVYLQTRATTCGVSCVMMILNLLRNLPLATSIEGKLRKKLKINRYDIIPAICLVMHLRANGLHCVIRHDFPHKFWEKMRQAPEDVAEQIAKKHAVAKKKGVEIQTGPISSEEIIDEIRKGLVILGIEIGGDIKHAILLYHSEQDNVYFIDPLRGKSVEKIDSLLQRATMDTGRWFISVRTEMEEACEQKNRNCA